MLSLWRAPSSPGGPNKDSSYWVPGGCRQGDGGHRWERGAEGTPATPGQGGRAGLSHWESSMGGRRKRKEVSLPSSESEGKAEEKLDPVFIL